MKRQIYVVLTVLSVMLLGRCQSGQTPENENIKSSYDEGKALASKYCEACHAKGSGRMRVAPSLNAVRTHYLDAFPEEEDFIYAIVDFVRHPSREKSVMPGAVEKFGLMSALSYSEDKIESIARYLYHVDESEGEEKGKGKRKRKHKDQQPSEDIVAFAMQTKKALGQQLMQAIERDGPAGAVDFCHIEAIPITDSMSEHLGVSVRRVSDKPRNPDNAATPEERKILKRMYKQMERRGEAFAYSDKELGRHYIPITTNAMCLQCHGVPGKTIDVATFEAIKEAYPNDSAVGYDVDQIRGMFVVTE
ncbi:MAG: DUF3365 domain-containing protein [Cryomorphaceae bacterium]|nr:DUF3365 domain-containing protein [Cryomorphaceae bacterium]